MHQRVGYAVTLSVVGFALTAPAAMATYNNWGPLSAYEGRTLVAQGKGSAGVDFSADVIGGHVTARDPRPGGSPAYSAIVYGYVQPNYDGPHTLRGSNNYTGSWIDQFKADDLNILYTQAELYGQTCQDDKLQPDACKRSGYFNQKW